MSIEAKPSHFHGRLNPPHRKSDLCKIECNNSAPGFDTWKEHDQALRERVSFIRQAEMRRLLNERLERILDLQNQLINQKANT